MRGDLAEAEHLVRYAWAATLAAGKRVLDAGCGVGYGSAMLARAGAEEVVGVDVAEAVVEVAREQEAPGINFTVGDVRDLDMEDDRFDLVVCFEVIEHITDGQRVIEELRRVLAPDGVLVISSPNRDAYVSGNPHHVHEYLPDELRAALAEAFTNVRLWRQHNWICSAVLDDDTFAADALDEVPGMWMRKVVAERPGRETYTVAVAGDARLPDPAPGGAMTGTAEVRKWLELYDEQAEILRRQHAHFENIQDRHSEFEDLRSQLAESERRLARLTALEQERDEAAAERDLVLSERAELVRAVEEANARAAEVHRTLDRVVAAPSWRITAPLRALKRFVRSILH